MSFEPEAFKFMIRLLNLIAYNQKPAAKIKVSKILIARLILINSLVQLMNKANISGKFVHTYLL